MLVYSILESTSFMSFLEQAVWSKICALSILVPVSEHIFHWNFPSSHKPSRGCTYTHLLEMSFSVHTINYAPYYLCTFDKIKTGRNVRSVDINLPWKNFFKKKFFILMLPVNLVSFVKWVINFDIILLPVYKTQIKSNLF